MQPLSVFLPLFCLLSISQAYELGAQRQQCNSLSARCPQMYHGEPENFEPDNRYVIVETAEPGVYRITFQNRPQDGNILGYGFQVRNRGFVSPDNIPRGYVTITNLTYDRLWPCNASDGNIGSNGVTHANSTKGLIDIEAGQPRNTVSFLWTATLTGGVEDTIECAMAVGSVVGQNTFWWEHLTSDCFLNCDLCDPPPQKTPNKVQWHEESSAN